MPNGNVFFRQNLKYRLIGYFVSCIRNFLKLILRLDFGKEYSNARKRLTISNRQFTWQTRV